MPTRVDAARDRMPRWVSPLLDRRRLVSAGVVALAGLSALFVVHAPFRIGVLSDLSSRDAVDDSRGTLLAATMALEDFGGRVLGRSTQILAGDTQGDPAVATDVATAWLDHKQTAVLLDSGGASVGLALRDLASQRAQVVLSVGSPADPMPCGPTIFQFTPSAAALAEAGLTSALAAGVDRWWLIAGSGEAGAALQRQATRVIEDHGATVVGAIDRRFGSVDADVVERARDARATGLVFASVGADLVDAIRQARALGLTQGRALVGMQVDIGDVAALGQAAAGLQFASAFYPAMTDNALLWSRRFVARHGATPPGSRQAMAYTATLHYLAGVRAAGLDSTERIVSWMRAQPVRDVLFRNAPVRADGRVLIDLQLLRVREETGSGPLDQVERFGIVKAEDLYAASAEAPCLSRL